MYDALTGDVVKILKGHQACVRDVSWHPYMNEIVSSSWDRRVIKWTFNEIKGAIDMDEEEFEDTKDFKLLYGY